MQCGRGNEGATELNFFFLFIRCEIKQEDILLRHEHATQDLVVFIQ